MSLMSSFWKIVKISFVPTLLILATLITFNYVIFAAVNDMDGSFEFCKSACETLGIELPKSGVGGMYDIYRYYAPLTFLLDTAIHSGEFPTWNPLTYCGLPNTGNPQAFLFYPPHLLRSLLTINPTPERSNITLAIMIGLHFLFMALCTYLLGRAHGLSLPGALTAAIAFAFSALIVRRMCEYHIITTIAWLPLLLLLIKKSIDSREFLQKMIFSLCGAIILGLSILGGFLQIVNLMGLVAGIYALFYFLLNSDWKADSGTLWRRLRPWMHNGIAMATLFILGSLLAAVLLLPAWELASFTLRTSGTAANKYSDLWAWSPLDFYQKLVVYAGIKYEAETIRNSGIIALLLAFAGLTHPKRRDVFLFLGMFLILFECSFGPPLPLGSLLEKVTPFSLSAYSRAYDFGLLPLSLLAGFGVDAISKPFPSRGKSYARAAVLILLAYIFIAPLGDWITQISPKKYISVNDTVRFIPIMGLVLMVALGVLHYPKTIRLILTFLLPLLLFSETFAWNQSYVPYMAHRKVRDSKPIKREDVRIPTENYRESDFICNRFLYSLRFAMNGVDPLHISAVRDMLSGPPRAAHPYRGVKEWETCRENLRGNTLFKRSFWLARQYAIGSIPGKRESWPTATTVFLDEPIAANIPKVEKKKLPRSSISDDYTLRDIRIPDPALAPVRRGKKGFHFLVEIPSTTGNLPAGSSGGVHSTLLYSYKSAGTATLKTFIKQPGTDRSEHGIQHSIRSTNNRVVFVEVPLPDFPKMDIQVTIEGRGPGAFQFTGIQLKSDNKDEDGLIQILDRTTNTVDLQVGPLEEPRILTFLDSYYPGWLAFVDGESVPILRADENFKAIVLSPGTHRVYFAFHHKLTWKAFYISMSTLVTILGLIFLCWFLKKRKMTAISKQEATAAP
ncbi:MAG: hypothetical protein KAH38_00060 [Candidatus Hydrogenedentes bacterium]|nr:hypothetical protein [Candidatus Hydrogenedentota bacterium]